MIIRTMRIYTQAFKDRVLEDLENNLPSYESARKKYKIKGNVTIANWIRKSGKTHLLHKSEVIDIEVL